MCATLYDKQLIKQIMETNQPENDGTFKISGNWDLRSKQLKSKFSILTDADLKFETGKENELLTRLELKLDKKRDEVISIIEKEQTEKI
jgi:hypothetical protein